MLAEILIDIPARPNRTGLTPRAGGNGAAFGLRLEELSCSAWPGKLAALRRLSLADHQAEGFAGFSAAARTVVCSINGRHTRGTAQAR